MTPFTYDPDIEGPRTHAFVIGVGDYPHVRNGQVAELQKVRNLPSAADSAKFMVDWLVRNKRKLAAPLATLEVLISDPVAVGPRYAWAQNGPVDRATEANVKSAGRAWWGRLNARPGDVAFFYCCGHGATHKGQPALFLEDLNLADENPWSFLNLGALAQSLRRNTNIGCAFMFSDACGEFIAEFESGEALECRFFTPPGHGLAVRDNVTFICAASETNLAYEGEKLVAIVDENALSFDEPVTDGTAVRLGRFSQVIVKAFDGASARLMKDRWAIEPSSLMRDLKTIRRLFFGGWKERAFEPKAYVLPNDSFAFAYCEGHEVPIVIVTDPMDRMPQCDLYVSERDDLDAPYLGHRPAGPAHAWLTSVPAVRRPYFALARHANRKHSQFVTPEPLSEQEVGIE